MEKVSVEVSALTMLMRAYEDEIGPTAGEIIPVLKLTIEDEESVLAQLAWDTKCMAKGKIGSWREFSPKREASE